MSVVPTYQKLLPADHPSKINFQFYAVDVKNIRSEINSTSGLILIPTQMVERLKNDDQLAAVLADGVAFNLQRQAARLIVANRISAGSEIVGGIAGIFVPGLGLGTVISSSVTDNMLDAMEKQRSRVALALLADAGYDPWQAPEAWRLLEPRRLPKDLNSLQYSDRTGYQLAILRLQYNARTPIASSIIQSEASESR